MMDDIPPRLHAPGFFDVIGGHRENRSAINRLRGNNAFSTPPGTATLAGRFWHGTNIKHAFVKTGLIPVSRRLCRSRSRRIAFLKPKPEAACRFCYAARHGR